MMKYAIILDGLVIGVAIWDGKAEWNPTCDELVELSDDSAIGPGWSYVNGEFVAPVRAEEAV